MGSLAQHLGELVHHGFHRECHLGLTRGAVGLNLLLVADDVVAIDQHVVHLVGPKAGESAAAHWGTRIRAGFIHHMQLAGDHCAVVFDAHLAAHEGGRCGAAADEDLGAIHRHLDRLAGLAGQDGSNRVRVGDALGAESAADFHGHNLHGGFGDADDGGGLGADVEDALGAGPDGHTAIGGPLGGGDVGLDVALVHGLGLELALDDDVGLGEALLDIADRVLDVSGNITLHAGIVAASEPFHAEVGGHVVV